MICDEYRFFFFFQAEDGIRDLTVTGVQTCALPILLIKDNHISVCGSIALAVKRARSGVPVLTRIEVECDTLEQVKEALAAGADMILLDNMGAEDMRRAVALSGGRVPLEASGGVRLETIRVIAETGVDFISVGRITQSAPAVDIGLDAVVRV